MIWLIDRVAKFSLMIVVLEKLLRVFDDECHYIASSAVYIHMLKCVVVGRKAENVC